MRERLLDEGNTERVFEGETGWPLEAVVGGYPPRGDTERTGKGRIDHWRGPGARVDPKFPRKGRRGTVEAAHVLAKRGRAAAKDRIDDRFHLSQKPQIRPAPPRLE
jgi:hypothetical protein